MNTDHDKLRDALVDLSVALKEGTQQDRKHALHECFVLLENTLSEEDLAGLALIVQETKSGLRVTTQQELECAAVDDFSLHIRWDVVLTVLEEKKFIELRQIPAQPADMDDDNELQHDENPDLDQIVILQLQITDPDAINNSPLGFSSNKSYVMACLEFLDRVIADAQIRSKGADSSKFLDAKYSRLRSKGQNTNPKPPLDILCDSFDLERTDFLIVLLALKAELNSNPINVCTATELLADSILDRYTLQEHFRDESKLLRYGILILDGTSRYGGIIITMEQSLVDWIIYGGPLPSTIADNLPESLQKRFCDNEEYIDAWLEISKLVLADLDDAPQRPSRRWKPKSLASSMPACEIVTIQHLLRRIRHSGTDFPLGKMIRDHNLDNNECIVLALALHSAIDKMQIPIDFALSRLAGDRPFLKLRYEKYFTPDSTLAKAGLIRVASEASDEVTFSLPRSALQDIMETHRVSGSNISSPFFERLLPENTLDKVILPPDIRNTLDVAMESLKPELQERLNSWGMDRALGSDSGNTQKILLFGEPGLGKSLTAMAYAASLGRLVLRTDAEKILSKWHGESEHNLVALFESYKRIADESSLPPVLLLEECDQLLARRGSGGDTSTDISEHRMQSLLLIQIERFEGILIATSNMVDSGAIDEAYSRRFQIKIRFPFPDAETRHALWEAHIPPMIPRSSDIDLRSLAHRYVFTGGQISIACHNSIRAVAIRGDFLKQDDLVCSCEAERSGSFEHHSHRRSETIGFLR